MNKLIEKLISSFGVSSRESSIRNIIKKEIELIIEDKNLDVDLTEDKIGNLVVKVGGGEKKIMICTHMDNAGIMATFIEDNGFIRVSPIGNLKTENLKRSIVRFENGVLGRIDVSGEKDLFIDLGVSNKEVAQRRISEGDVAEIAGHILESGSKIVSSNLHSKLNCYALIQVIKSLSNINNQVYFVFSSQKEMGFKGARAAARDIKPDICIVLDSLEARDYPNGKGNIKLESGPIISIFDKSLLIHHKVKEELENISENLNINIQYSIDDGKNEGGLIHKEVGGIKTGMIGVPCRYMYTCEEMVSLEDINNTVSLIKAFVSSANI